MIRRLLRYLFFWRKPAYGYVVTSVSQSEKSEDSGVSIEIPANSGATHYKKYTPGPNDKWSAN